METLGKLKLFLIPILCCSIFLFINCQNKKVKESNADQIVTSKDANSEIINNQLIKLLNAIKNRNIDTLKTFFTFPVNNQYFWYKVLTDSELENKNLQDSVSIKDFEKYCNKFFDAEIEKTIATLRFEMLLEEGSNCINSDTITVQNGKYLNKCVLSIDFHDKNLVLSLLSNIYDENNNFLSEHIDNYFFNTSSNRLIFYNFEMID